MHHFLFELFAPAATLDFPQPAKVPFYIGASDASTSPVFRLRALSRFASLHGLFQSSAPSLHSALFLISFPVNGFLHLPHMSSLPSTPTTNPTSALRHIPSPCIFQRRKRSESFPSGSCSSLPLSSRAMWITSQTLVGHCYLSLLRPVVVAHCLLTSYVLICHHAKRAVGGRPHHLSGKEA